MLGGTAEQGAQAINRTDQQANVELIIQCNQLSVEKGAESITGITDCQKRSRVDKRT
jgi:hypothetical protein